MTSVICTVHELHLEKLLLFSYIDMLVVDVDTL